MVFRLLLYGPRSSVSVPCDVASQFFSPVQRSRSPRLVPWSANGIVRGPKHMTCARIASRTGAKRGKAAACRRAVTPRRVTSSRMRRGATRHAGAGGRTPRRPTRRPAKCGGPRACPFLPILTAPARAAMSPLVARSEAADGAPAARVSCSSVGRSWTRPRATPLRRAAAGTRPRNSRCPSRDGGQLGTLG